jgi:hypothetical protein
MANRRRLLEPSGLALAGGIAGCSADAPESTPEGTATDTETGTTTETGQVAETFEHTFETEGVYNYYCTPHEALGTVGLVVVGGPQGGPGTEPPEEVLQSRVANALSRLLDLSGVAGAGGERRAYSPSDATWDSYWYSLYNMSTNVAMSGSGVLFPHNEQQRKAFEKRVPAMLKHADVDEPPVKNPNLNVAAFTEGDPHFTQKPVLSGPDGRPDAATLTWDAPKSSKVVSPASLAWTHLKGVTWAKNFQSHFGVLPQGIAAKFRSQMLTTVAQIGVDPSLIAGGPDGNGALTRADGSFPLVSGFDPAEGESWTGGPDRPSTPRCCGSSPTSPASRGTAGTATSTPNR